VTALFRTLGRDDRVRYALLGVGVLLLVVGVGAFAMSASGSVPDPIPFEQTTATGIGGEPRQEVRDRGLHLPRAQVFYSQYQFVVGYRGVSHAVDQFQQPGHEQQFGYPIAVYVSDFAGTGATLTEEGYIDTQTDPGWVSAESATFVVGSEVSVPGGESAVPFGSRAAAEEFAAEYGGELYDWETLQDHEFDIDGAAVVRERIDGQREFADERIAAVRPLADREVSVVVGEDAPTIQAAIDAAENHSTVLVPPGHYDENVTIDRPITLRGNGATVDGGGNGSVIRVRHDEVAVVGLDIVGIGDNLDPDENRTVEGWDESIESAYGYGDAAVAAVNASGVYVSDLTIDTQTNGVLFRDSEQTAVENVSIQGSENWIDGFMGVLAMRSPTVIQNVTVNDGRDGVYLHRSHGTVIRNNSFTGNRFGVHLMYTSDTLIADNVAREQTSAGITIMTDPSHNAVVGNDVRNASAGILPAGARSYFAENVLVDNDRGLITGADQSLYERNLLFRNEMGMRASSIRPSNRVVANDFVDNGVAVEAGGGPLRIWAHGGSGNYWSGLADRPGGVPDRYTPTDPLDGQTHRVAGTATLAASPAATALDAVRSTTPGLRDGAVMDTAPRATPVQPDLIAAVRAQEDGVGPAGPRTADTPEGDEDE
jgi:parallel beta-helix repeat protein